MKTIPLIFFTSINILFLTACQVKELPVPAHQPGSVITASADMGSSYKWQVYYSLEDNAVKSKVLKTSWDLGFENGDEGHRIILNSSKLMFAYNTQKNTFSEVTDTLGFENGKSWDEPSGNLDSTAIGDWNTSGKVYIIDRGYDENGISQGFIKIQFQSVNTTEYIVKFSNINGSGESTISIPKNEDYNFTFLSFEGNGAIVSVEPPKDQWDLCFTQYTYIFYNPTMPYLVTGCLHNRHNTTAAELHEIPFDQLKFSDINEYTFFTAIDLIGYDWKTFNGSTYTTDVHKSFLLKNSSEKVFKLHFIDFYTNTGEKGNPRWEFQAL